MEWADLLQRIEAGENRNTEFKREFEGDLSGIGKAICAFANGTGGLIVVGIDDAGAVVGLNADPHAVHERLTNLLQSGCSAPVMARCGRNEVENGWVHWIQVPRIRGLEPLRCDGRYYIRRERSSVEPSPQELQELFNAFGFVFTENQMVRWTSAGDIDMNAFRSFVLAQGLETQGEPQPSPADDLRNAGVLAEAERGFLSDSLRPYGLRQDAAAASADGGISRSAAPLTRGATRARTSFSPTSEEAGLRPRCAGRSPGWPA